MKRTHSCAQIFASLRSFSQCPCARLVHAVFAAETVAWRPSTSCLPDCGAYKCAAVGSRFRSPSAQVRSRGLGRRNRNRPDRVAADFLRALIKAVPYKIHIVLTDKANVYREQQALTMGAPISQHPATQAQPPLISMNRTIKEATVNASITRPRANATSSDRLRQRLQFRAQAEEASPPL